MTEFANKAALPLRLKDVVYLVDSAGLADTTPEVIAPLLGDMSRLSYLKGSVVYDMEISTAEACTVTLDLMAGATVLGTQLVTFAAGIPVVQGRFDVDLMTAGGAQPLLLRATVGTQATAGKTVTQAAVLEIEHPVVITG